MEGEVTRLVEKVWGMFVINDRSKKKGLKELALIVGNHRKIPGFT